MKNILFSLFLLLGMTLQAQTILSGKVVDVKGVAIFGANVYLENTYDGTTSDENGLFQFETTEKGTKTLIVSYLGFATYKKALLVSAMKNRFIKLKESVNTLDAVVLTAGAYQAGGKAKVTVLKPLDVVTTAGEAGDYISAMNTLPGTQSVAEDGRLYVRGGEAGEVQTYIDGARVFKPYASSADGVPTRGRFSPFLFDGFTFSTGGYSAEYGQALSSVLLLNTISYPTQNKTNIGIMDLGLSLGHTIKQDSTSFSVNAMYINLKPYQNLIPDKYIWHKAYNGVSGEMVFRQKFKKGLLKVYGAYGRANYDVSQNNINYITKIRTASTDRNWYFNASYVGEINDKTTFKSSASYSRNNNDTEQIGLKRNQKENGTYFKINLKHQFTERIKLLSGVSYSSQDYSDTFVSKFNSNIAAAYLEADWFLNKNIGFKFGLRGENTKINKEFKLAPRLSLAVKTSQNGQLALSYGHFYQLADTKYLKYNRDFDNRKATHYIANYQYKKGKQLFIAEAYYKKYEGLIKYDTAYLNATSILSQRGDAYAKGLDIFWRDAKTFDNFEYWLSYSYLDSKRDYKNYPYAVAPSFTSKHNVSLVGKYWSSKLKSQIGFAYNFASGRPYDNPNEAAFMALQTKTYNNLSFNWAYLISQQKIVYLSVTNVFGFNNVSGFNYKNTPDINGRFAREAITPAAKRGIFIGYFWTISENKKTNQLKDL
jgi:hypothetical protein